MKHIIDVENISGSGCVTTISKRLKEIPGVENISVNIEDGRVSVEAHEDSREVIISALHASGYPLKGTVEGIEAAREKAKSFVSCTVGKMK